MTSIDPSSMEPHPAAGPGSGSVWIVRLSAALMVVAPPYSALILPTAGSHGSSKSPPDAENVTIVAADEGQEWGQWFAVGLPAEAEAW